MSADRQSSKSLQAMCNCVNVILRFAARDIPNSIVDVGMGSRTLVFLLFSTKNHREKEAIE